jgi:hypothetical protein
LSLYAVFLHVKGLSLTDPDQNARIGGAYAWRRVEAPDPESAVERAADSLLQSPTFIAEAGVLSARECDITAEKVVPLAPDEELRQKSIVFYIDTDEQDA